MCPINFLHSPYAHLAFKHVNINHFDLNLLRVFHAILREGSMTAAGAQLGLTQSATSHALMRLRKLCNDPLFVRTTHGMKPTAYGQLLAEPVEQAVRAIRNVLELDMQSDPATSTRSFVVVTTDVAELIFLPKMMARLTQAAPGISIVVKQLGREQYRAALESGNADLALGQLPEFQTDFHQQHLFDEPLVCLMRQDHPRIGRRITKQQFMEEAQVAIVAPALVDGFVKRALGKGTVQRRIALHLPHYMVVPMILAQSDLIAVVPKTLATTFAPLVALKALPLPFDVPPVRVRQFWHQRSHHDPVHRWLRNTIAELFKR